MKQGLQITLNQLTKLKQALIEQHKELNKALGVKDYENYFDWDTKFQINIINKTPKCSDTWEIEDGDV